MDGKDRIKITTKEKNYLFKFSTSDAAKDWHDSLRSIVNTDQ
jgi:hypothetical protein